jgi:hypothetical protein
MYRVPLDLDLSTIVGESTTQIRVGQFDVQFTFGPVSFAIQSPVSLVRNGEVIGRWAEGRWPDSGFFETMNVKVSSWKIPNDRTILIHLENGIEIHLMDDSDSYECMQISTEGSPRPVIII